MELNVKENFFLLNLINKSMYLVFPGAGVNSEIFVVKEI